MTLPFGTRVTHCPNGMSTFNGVVVGADPANPERHAVAWDHLPGSRPKWYDASELTVIESPAESALREIGRMLSLPLDAEPAAIVGAVADLKARLFVEVSKPPVCVKIDPARFVSLGNGLRTVTAEAVRDGDWIWGHYRADADCKVIVWPTPCQKEPHHKTTLGRNYILGPDPATLICEASPAPAEETVWGEP